jgi:hypothetical protein
VYNFQHSGKASIENEVMFQDNQPILNLEQAKSYFQKMGCSHFHLDREDYQRRDEYDALAISAALEDEWRKEEFERQLAAFKSVEPGHIGSSYFRLSELAERNEFYLEHMLTLTNDIQQSIPPDQIEIVLNSIVGTYGTITHGGLIEKAYTIERPDLAQGFVKNVKSLLTRAENNTIPLPFVRAHLLDITEHFHLNESAAYLTELRKNNHTDNFEYYKEGANEGNIFAMRMLARHYIEGLGCEVSIDDAKYWLTRAADSGNELAKTELLKLN